MPGHSRRPGNGPDGASLSCAQRESGRRDAGAGVWLDLLGDGAPKAVEEESQCAEATYSWGA